MPSPENDGLTEDELYAVEYALRKIPDRDKSDLGLRIHLWVRAEIRSRARLPLADEPEEGREPEHIQAGVEAVRRLLRQAQ